MNIPICCVTGLIAGDTDACGDCDLCSAANMVPEAVKRLMIESDHWCEKYSDAMVKCDEMLAALMAVKHGAEYPDELGDIIDAAIAIATAPSLPSTGSTP